MIFIYFEHNFTQSGHTTRQTLMQIISQTPVEEYRGDTTNKWELIGAKRVGTPWCQIYQAAQEAEQVKGSLGPEESRGHGAKQDRDFWGPTQLRS